jgi:hypothetical protein
MKQHFTSVKVRIDHRTQSVHFGTDLTESQRTDLPEGPHVQAMPSEQVSALVSPEYKCQILNPPPSPLESPPSLFFLEELVVRYLKEGRQITPYCPRCF